MGLKWLEGARLRPAIGGRCLWPLSQWWGVGAKAAFARPAAEAAALVRQVGPAVRDRALRAAPSVKREVLRAAAGRHSRARAVAAGLRGPVGDASSSSGDVAAEASCDAAPLWHAVAFSAFSAVCSPNPAGVAYIVLDGEGWVVDNSMYAGDPVSLQTWLDSLGTQRWPCVAGQTIHYSCLSI